MTTPTKEPTTFVAGDTVTWKRSFSDFPASAGWTLKYRFIDRNNAYDVTAGASGDDYLVTLAASVTATWVANDYRWIAWVEKGVERHTVDTGVTTISPNLAALNLYDDRTVAQRMVAALEKAQVDYAEAGQGHIGEYDILGRRVRFRSAIEIERQLNYWRSQLAQEEKAARLAAGKPTRNRLRIRFKK